MKAFGIIAKIVVALAAVAGAVYVVATYGDKIVAWAKNLINSRKCCCEGECECECDCECECECDCECDCTEEEIEETVADDVVAAETDFEG